MSSTLVAEPPKITRSTWVSSFRKDRLRSGLVILWLVLAGSALVHGLDYYLADASARAIDPAHDRLSAEGSVGFSLGLAGTVLILLGVGSYSVRKRTSWLYELGTMRSWLYVHIFLCTLGAFLIFLHAAFQFNGLVSATTWSLMIVLFSGAIGRFVYGWIPKTVHGRFLTPEELEAERERLSRELIAVVNCSVAQAKVWLGATMAAPRPTLPGAVYGWLRYRLSRPSRRARLAESLQAVEIKGKRNTEAVRIVLAENRVHAQMALLKPFHELFGRWHRIHVRLVAALAVVIAIHVVIVAMAGKAWML